MMPEVLKGLSDFAAASTSVIAIFTLTALTVAGIKFLIKLPAQVRAYFFRPKYIIVPTVDEIAKYCVPSYDPRPVSPEEYDEIIRYRFQKYYRNFRKTAEIRINYIYFFFFCVFLIFVIRLCYLGLFSLNFYARIFICANLFVAVLYLMALWRIASKIFSETGLRNDRRPNIFFIFGVVIMRALR